MNAAQERENHLGSVISTLELQIKILSDRHNKDVEEIAEQKIEIEFLVTMANFESPFDKPVYRKKVMELSSELQDSNLKIAELRELFKEAADYLDINELTSIGSCSVLHQKFREQG